MAAFFNEDVFEILTHGVGGELCVIEVVIETSKFDPHSGCVYPGRVKRVVSAMLPMLVDTTGCIVVLSPGEEQRETAKDFEARRFVRAARTTFQVLESTLSPAQNSFTPV